MTPLLAKLWTRVDNGRLIRVNRLIFPGHPHSTLGCRAPTHIIASHKSRGLEGLQGSLPPSGLLGNNCLLCPCCRCCPSCPPCFGRARSWGSAPPPHRLSPSRGCGAGARPGTDSRWIRPKRARFGQRGAGGREEGLSFLECVL